MQTNDNMNPKSIAHWVGWSLLASIAIGICSAFFLVQGININLSADVVGTAENMLEAEMRLQAKAYLAGLLFCIGTVTNIGLYLILKRFGPLLAGWSVVVGIGASVLALLGGVYALNAAQIAGNEAYQTLSDENGRLLLTGLQATSDYTSFHLALIISSLSMAGFFWLFWRSQLIPKLISGFGVFACLFVATTIVTRDFVPVFGANMITVAFMLCNMIALVSLALYLAIKGIREN